MPEELIKREEQTLALGLGVLLAIETVFIAVIVLAVGASVGVAIGLIALMNGILIGTLLLITRLLWLPWQRRYPARPIEDNAVTRTWQSFVFGYLGGFNHCLSITADEHCLHLHPFFILKWFGAERISLPWDRMSRVKKSLFGTMSARIDGRRIAGPDWAMRLAVGDDAP